MIDRAANRGRAARLRRLADYLVKKGLAFRDAHEAVARAVRAAETKGCDLDSGSSGDTGDSYPIVPIVEGVLVFHAGADPSPVVSQMRSEAPHPLGPAVLAGTVDLLNITRVRIVDIPGRGDFTDTTGAPVYDVWTTFGSAGFDLEAVGVIHHQPGIVGGAQLCEFRQRRGVTVHA